MANALLTNTAINGGTPVRILARSLKISGKKNVTKTPQANGLDYVEVQTNSYENLTYTFTMINETGEPNTLTWDNVLAIYKQQFNGNNYSTLNVTYGTDNVLNGLSGTTDIKVILEAPSVDIDTSKTKDGYIPSMSLQFVETK